MKCKYCGADNPPGSIRCNTCGFSLAGEAGSPAAVPPGSPPPMPHVPGPGGPPEIKNYMVQSLLATIFCCLPVGIFAVLAANQVNQKIAQGDIQGAMEQAAKAKKLSLIALIAGGVGLVIYFAVMGLSILAMLTTQ